MNLLSASLLRGRAVLPVAVAPEVLLEEAEETLRWLDGRNQVVIAEQLPMNAPAPIATTRR